MASSLVPASRLARHRQPFRLPNREAASHFPHSAVWATKYAPNSRSIGGLDVRVGQVGFLQCFDGIGRVMTTPMGRWRAGILGGKG